MITVTPTTADDAEILAGIQKEAFRPLYERYHDERNPHLRGAEDITRRLNRAEYRYFTIREDGKIVGGIYYVCTGSTPFLPVLAADECYLGRIYIAPERQGYHIAREAIRMTVDKFPAARRFYVDFPMDLEKNRRCYASAGFRDTGRRMEIENGKLTLAFYCMEREVQK